MEKDTKRLRRTVLLYTLLMPTLTLLCLWLLWGRIGENTVNVSTPPTNNGESEYIYVYLEPEPNESDKEQTEQMGWVLREHEEQIGVFSKDGVLLQTLDVYIKTLPKADQLLLREGIAVSSRQELCSLMEDYGG